MKKLIFSINLLLAVAASALLSSCGSDNDSKWPSAEEILAAVNNMKGNYTGSLNAFLLQDGKATASETVAPVLWEADDKGITLKNFPLAQISRAITAENSDELKAALEAYTGDTDVRMDYNFCFSAKEEYAFSLVPSELLLSLEYGGSTHQVSVQFYQQSAYTYVNGNKASQNIQTVAIYVYVDGRSIAFTPMGFYYTTTEKKPAQ